MAVNFKLSFIGAAAHHCGHLPYHPDHAQHMIRVGMGDEHTVYFFHRDLRLLQPGKDSVSAACIHQKVVLCVLYAEACIIASGHHGMSGSQHNQIAFH